MGQGDPQLLVLTRPRLRSAIVGQPQTDASTPARDTGEFAKRARRHPLRLLFAFWLRIDPHDVVDAQAFGALTQMIWRQLDRRVDARGLDLNREEPAHQHEEDAWDQQLDAVAGWQLNWRHGGARGRTRRQPPPAGARLVEQNLRRAALDHRGS